MTINSKTLRHLRDQNALTQADLADKCRSVSAKTIGRIELGQIANPRANTRKELANALGVKPEALAVSPAEQAEHDGDRRPVVGHRKIPIHMPGRAALSLELVERRYGVSAQSQLALAPLLLTVLAETSLAARRRRLESLQAAHEAYLDALPDYLDPGPNITGHQMMFEAEKASVDACDLFGESLPRVPELPEPGEVLAWESNPFFDFLRETIRDVEAQGAGAIAELDWPGPDGLPHAMYTQVLPELLDEIAGDDRYARAALEDGDVRIRDIPDDLWEEGRAADRAAWLAARLSPETRKRLDIPIKL